MTSKPKSKFGDVFGAIKGGADPEPVEQLEPEPAPPAQPEITPTQEPAPKKRGRAPGKRSDPNYELVGAYIKKTTYTAVQDALWQESRRAGRKKEYSDLVEELLSEWLNNQKTS
jgi:hypothetical protein